MKKTIQIFDKIYLIALNLFDNKIQIVDKAYKVNKQEKRKIHLSNDRIIKYCDLERIKNYSDRYYIYYSNLNDRNNLYQDLRDYLKTILDLRLSYTANYIQRLKNNDIEKYICKDSILKKQADNGNMKRQGIQGGLL